MQEWTMRISEVIQHHNDTFVLVIQLSAPRLPPQTLAGANHNIENSSQTLDLGSTHVVY